MIYRGSSKYVLLLLLSFVLVSCLSNTNEKQVVAGQKGDSIIRDSIDVFFAEGFDYPVGNPDGKGQYTCIATGKKYDSWYCATRFAELYSLGVHPGIDLNGNGGGNTDLGQPVFSIANGVVVTARDFGSPWGNLVIIKHHYLENGKNKICYSVYAHLEKMLVKERDTVLRRDEIGKIGTGGGSYSAHLHLEIRKENMQDLEPTYWPGSHDNNVEWVKEHYEDPENFIKTHRKLICPREEDRLIIAVKHEYALYYYEKGSLKCKYEIALSQNPVGHKQVQGDLKMPEGEYYICEKQKGPFYGAYSNFLGSRILRISYPNVIDARQGFEKGLISESERDQIYTANKNKSIPPKNTKLGGGIVIHGWSGDWVADGNQNLTWGCISMHNKDLEAFFEKIPLKTKIIIRP